MPAALVPVRLRSLPRSKSHKSLSIGTANAMPVEPCEKIRNLKIEKLPSEQVPAPRGLPLIAVFDAPTPLFTEICHDTK